MALYQRFARQLYRYINANMFKGPDDIYLTYYDASITYEDYNTLKSDWLTDNVIGFWEEYLEHELLSFYKTRIILLRPSMSFLLFQTPDPKTLGNALPDFNRASHIFLPINDCQNGMQAEGGTHWSLLLVSLADQVAFHYDSLPPGNITEAHAVTEKISIICEKPIKFMQMPDCPVQQNNNDCGVFVCMMMRYLLQHRLLQANSKEYITMALDGVPLDPAEARKEIVQIIHQLKRDRDRRRSYVTSSADPAAASRIFAKPHSIIARTQSSPAHRTPATASSTGSLASTRPRHSRVSLFTYFAICASVIVLIAAALAFYLPDINMTSLYHGYTHIQPPVCGEYCHKLDSALSSARSQLSPYLLQMHEQLNELHDFGREYFAKVYDAFSRLRRI
ncbi:hypothetical protein H112_06882 [Trichophyton rubrum D6]|uniref:Ubiquitin-like protease family profile domain-containing protein n=7 Tax=Trichophyton TaxID=5550 RepID=F2SGA2_TRIRC|nr:uncharacterized protein TERG_02225 [Trichophyton rubrum CBS 118892]EZF12081.1 hypothetical protein H100_06906 [Trichophyton rubrum MR850]EZF38901.1 hypothetical protein H102_06867 [Trichophyton rubrum CBS 100081]EZF49501.1 hypothetical protein H103_06891 [Trichophyton rubrum CBS 288.86]EZF60127.1 hypothetical protein H104_06845 [Trichophyton rubrum CBS 289.86]EZF70827.1 hypothetical protein H105_06907 [Trichophyton soudanense CBS 452.61]EZF81501.1 hypothetical protein H110_06886 [Trichophy